MFRTLQSVVARRLSRACSLSLVAGFAMLAMAAPASAGHGYGRAVIVQRPAVVQSCRPVAVQRPVVVHRPVHQVVVHSHGDACACDACGWQREYKRGFNRGEAAGSNSGYRDGINGKNFCDAPIDELRDNTRAYRDGYLASFKPTYRAAFERGRRDAASSCQEVVIVKR